MRYGTTSHPKFQRLKRLLSQPQYAVVGLLESIWMLAAQFTDSGDVSKFSPQDICDYAGYEGDPIFLINSLVESRWLDRDGDKLLVHDFLDHAPSFIYERNKKREQRKSKEVSNVPTCPGTVRDNPGPSHDVPGMAAQSSVVECSVVNITPVPGSGDGGVIGRKYKKISYPETFEQFWTAFPAGRKQDKKTTFQRWQAAVKEIDRDAPDVWLIDRATVYASSPKGKGNYVKSPEVWLTKGSYDDPPEAWGASKQDEYHDLTQRMRA